MSTIGDKVKAYREHPTRRLTTKQLADRVGTSRQNIENLESGAVRLPHYLVELADEMQMSIDALLGRQAPHAAAPLQANEPPAAYGQGAGLSAALHTVAKALQSAPIDRRPALADNMAGWAREAGALHYCEVIALLLTPAQDKRQSNGW